MISLPAITVLVGVALIVWLGFEYTKSRYVISHLSQQVAIEQEQLLRRGHGAGAPGCVHVGVGVVERGQEGIELLAADAPVDGAPPVGRVGDLA